MVMIILLFRSASIHVATEVFVFCGSIYVCVVGLSVCMSAVCCSMCVYIFGYVMMCVFLVVYFLYAIFVI